MKSNVLIKQMNLELAAASAELVGNEELLRCVFAGCGDCIKILDLDGRVQFMSEGGKRVMEVDDFSALKGCPWPDFWPDEGNALAIAAVQAARDGKTARFAGAANTARGSAKYWDVQVSPIFGADGKPSQILSISRDVTAEHEAVERQRFLMRELEHRVKNTLSIILAIAARTFQGEVHRAARETFIGRVMNLNQANDILKESHWTETPVRRIVEGTLVQFPQSQENFRISGPKIDLNAKQALALALALNELGTNALKYGALSVPSGQIAISWDRTTIDGIDYFDFEWRETGGPAVVTPARHGFGSRVIKDMTAAEFGGAIELSFDPTGVIFKLRSRMNRPGQEEPQDALTAI